MGLRGITLSAVLALGLGLVGVVVLTDSTPSVRDVRLEVLGHVAMIHHGPYQGSGLAIGDGMILTAAHVVLGEEGDGELPPPVVEFPGGTPCEAEIFACDAEEDLALLLVPGLIGLRDFRTVEPRVFDAVFVAGCPRGRARVCMPAEIMTLDDVIEDNFYHSNSSPMTRGTSGGPVFMVRGGRPVLLGVVSRMDREWQHVQWFVPGWRVTRFLERVILCP